MTMAEANTYSNNAQNNNNRSHQSQNHEQYIRDEMAHF